MKKKILVPNGSFTDIELIKAYKAMGLYVITSGNAPTLGGHKYSDEYICHDYSDKEGMLELAKQNKIDYVSSCANDFGVLTAAYIAEKMNLPGHDAFAVARVIAEKDLFKDFAQKNGIQVIPSKGFTDPKPVKEFIEGLDYPIIIKPTDLTGGKGVSRADSREEALCAIDAAFKKSKAKHIVIEPFLVGKQQSICTFLVNRKVVSWTSYNEYGASNDPYLVGFTSSPADGIERFGNVLVREIEKIADLLSLTDGVFHVQYIVKDDKPYIMECMRRCLGNHALLAGSDMLGYSLESWIAKAYCGFDCSGIPNVMGTDGVFSEYYVQAPKNGIVKDVEVSPELAGYIYRKIDQWEPGEEITRFQTDMLGYLFMRFSSIEERDSIMNSIADFVKVDME